MPFHPPNNKRRRAGGLQRTHSEGSLGSVSQRRRSRISTNKRRPSGTGSTISQTWSLNHGNFAGCCQSKKKTAPLARMERTLWKGRLLFLAGLVMACSALAWATVRVMRQREHDMATAVFQQQAVSMLTSLQAAVHAQAAAAVTLARYSATATATATTTSTSTQQPSFSSWPFVRIPHYESLAADLLVSSQSRRIKMDADEPMSFDMMMMILDLIPLVPLDQLTEFEQFVANHTNNNNNNENNNNDKNASRKIWYEGGVRRPPGVDWVAPIVQVPASTLASTSTVPSTKRRLLYDFMPTRFAEIQNVMNCVAKSAAVPAADAPSTTNTTTTISTTTPTIPPSLIACAQLHWEPMILENTTQAAAPPPLLSQSTQQQPVSRLFQPIIVYHDNEQQYKVVGLITTVLDWNALLRRFIFWENGSTGPTPTTTTTTASTRHQDTTSIEVVLRDTVQGTSWTWRIEKNRRGGGLSSDSDERMEASLGDWHDTSYNDQGISISLSLLDQNGKSAPPTSLTLSMYPTDDFYNAYQTNKPIWLALGVLGIFVITGISFLIYDLFVRREFMVKKDLLEAKRRFMRFVSHEVRTPLNAVCMGLDVMQCEMDTELASVFGCLNNTSKNNNATAPRDNITVATDCLSMLQDVRLSAQSAVDVLNTMLNYDKVEQNALSLDVSILPMWSLVCNVVKEFTLSATNKKIVLTWKVLETDQHTNGSNDNDYGQHHDLESGTTPGGGEGVASQMTTALDRLAPDAQEVCVLGDAPRLKQVLRNLISNAIKFTHENGTVEIEAVISRTRRPWEWQALSSRSDARVRRFGNVRLTVRDTGVGMTQEQLAKVFREGSRFNVNELQNIQGSGLGMYISKEIMERHQGSLQAESDGLGQGTTFIVNLPLYLAETPARNSDSSSRLPETGSLLSTASFHQAKTATTSTTSTKVGPEGSENTASSGPTQKESSLQNNNNNGSTTPLPNQEPTRTRKGADSARTDSSAEDPPPASLKILLVDDVSSNRKLLRRLLERQGHSCEEAENGQLAVDLYQNSPVGTFDTILMDYEMPVMNGPTAVQTLRDLGCDLVIIGVTGNMLPEDVDYFEACGANAVVPKPLRWPELLELWHDFGLTRRKANKS